MAITKNVLTIERSIKSLLVQLPTCRDCLGRPIHNIRVFDCQDILGEHLFAIRHPFEFGGKTVLISERQILDELDRQAFRLPDDRFRPLSENMKHLLGFDTLGPAYDGYRMDYQTVVDSLMPELRDNEGGYHFCRLTDQPSPSGTDQALTDGIEQSLTDGTEQPSTGCPDLMVRIWRREYIGLPAPECPYDWDPYPRPSCHWEPEEFWFYWLHLSHLLPAPLSYGEADRSPYHYVPADEGHYCVHIDWYDGDEVCIQDNIAYLVLQPHGLTEEEKSAWPKPRTLPADQGIGWV